MGPRLLGNSQGLKVHGASPGVSNFALKITLTTKTVSVVAHNQEENFLKQNWNRAAGGIEGYSWETKTARGRIK